jgi:TonB-linked SusC/RagA family outer membrane protein
MKKRLFAMLPLLALGLAATAGRANAQTGLTISGRVTSDAGAPLQGASVSIGPMNIGAYTQADGSYRFTIVPSRVNGQQVTLSARRIGFAPKNVSVTLTGITLTQDFSLATSTTQLEGVVVTALGLEKEKSQLGTAQQQIASEELNRTHDQSVVNQIAGKVAGVSVVQSGTQGGSSKILVRGNNSINGNNNPLFVVDGVPVGAGPLDDRGSSPGGANTGHDFGSSLNDLNPDNIESMTILKGPNAAALYGSRAANGVIVISTKKGRNTGGKILTDFSASFTTERPSILPSYQNLYGQGAGGDFQYVDGQGGGIQDGNDQSYGPKMDGRLIDQFTGKAQPWIPHPDNVKSFFATGKTAVTNFGFSGGTDRSSARLSVGAENTSGYIPNNFFQKVSGLLNGQLAVNDKLSSSATIQYLKDKGQNRPGVGYNTGILEQFIWFGRQVDMNALHTYFDKNGGLYNWNYNYHNNPFWMQYENPLKDGRDQVISSVSATYKVITGVNATVRNSNDWYRSALDLNYAQGNLNYADPSYAGAFDFTNDYKNENNTELLVTANRALTSKITFNGAAGANNRFEQFNTNRITTSGISVPGIYNVANAAIAPTPSNQVQRRQVVSGYGSASFTWNGFWTVEGTGRQDISSTLPKGNNTYFYPSVNSSLVLTEAIPALKSRMLSFAKLRGSYAQVGNDAAPYQLSTVYNGNANKFASLPLFTLDNTVANAKLKPEITTSNEYGMELGFLDGRASLDATWYEKNTKNQIINLTVSAASGYNATAINAGRIKNTGIELLLNLTAFRSRDVEWSTAFNYSRNRGTVEELYGGLKTIVLGSQWGANVEARLNEPYGSLFGVPWARDSATGKLILNNGIPTAGTRAVLGNIQPDWIGGWSNTVRYKRFTLSGLVDMHIGGDIFSISNYFGQYSGVFIESLRGREVDWDKPGIVVDGIDKKTGQANTVRVTSEQYFQGLFNLHEQSIYRNTWIKLRELRVGWDVPPKVASRFYASAANLSFVGRNLLTQHNVPNIDPEFSYSTGNAQGMEFAALPNPRSVGVSLRITP